jgi:hypothetical protein
VARKKTGLDIRYCLVGPAPKKFSAILDLPPLPTARKKKLHPDGPEKKQTRPRERSLIDLT